MVDVVDSKTRSRMMRNIRGKDTRPELILRRALHQLGLRFRLHRKDLPGKPDIVMPKFQAAIFVHGCFWHRHENCRYATTPKTRPEFWLKKFEGNVARDRRNLLALREAGWRTAIVWECALKGQDRAAPTTELVEWLFSANNHLELPNEVPPETSKSLCPPVQCLTVLNAGPPNLPPPPLSQTSLGLERRESSEASRGTRQAA